MRWKAGCAGVRWAAPDNAFPYTVPRARAGSNPLQGDKVTWSRLWLKSRASQESGRVLRKSKLSFSTTSRQDGSIQRIHNERIPPGAYHLACSLLTPSSDTT